jgi:two-component system phosphate regulon sensor histidine kinase PhoR
MKLSDPKSLAAFNAGLIAAFVSVLYGANALFIDNFHFLYVLALFACVFGFGFLLIRYSIDKFLYEKIRVIYKTIHKFKTGKGENSTFVKSDKDTIKKVEHDILDWSRKAEDEFVELKKMEQYRREFVGNVSHELKTPIFNIQGYILTLLDGGLDDPSINKDFLLRTEASVNRMITILEDLDQINRLESDAFEVNIESFDINKLVGDVFEFLEIKAGKRGVQLILENQDRQLMVMGDREKIMQVLINLVDNSIKYIDPEAESKISKVSVFDMDEHYLVEVSDNGRGIPEESLSRIFERFYRTDKGRSRDEGGSGLGLAIVKHIIEAHNQTINVRSSLGKGTTFSFTLKKVNR